MNRYLKYCGVFVFASGVSAAVAGNGSAQAVDLTTGGGDGTGVGPAGGGTYTVPNCPSLNYDGYFGQVGVDRSSGFAGFLYHAPATTGFDRSDYTSAAYSNHVNGHGAGAGAYYFMGGPNYLQVPYSAYGWGQEEAIAATNDYNAAAATNGNEFTFGYIMADVEAPASSYGWQSGSSGVYNNQQLWDGFYQYLQSAGTNVGVYSDVNDWSNIMGGQPVAQIEWTYQQDFGPVTPCPGPSGPFSGGPGGTVAQFFYSTNSAYDLTWQWSQSGGDYNSFDLTRWDNLFGLNYKP